MNISSNNTDYLFGSYSASSGGPSPLSREYVEVTVSSMGRNRVNIAAITPDDLHALMLALGSPTEAAKRDSVSARLALQYSRLPQDYLQPGCVRQCRYRFSFLCLLFGCKLAKKVTA